MLAEMAKRHGPAGRTGREIIVRRLGFGRRWRCMRIRNLSIPVKISTVVLGIVISLQITGLGQAGNKATPAPSAEAAKTPSGDIPLCNGASPGAASGHAPSHGNKHPHAVTLSWKAALPTSDSPLDAIKGYYVYRSLASHRYAESNKISQSPVSGTQCADTTVHPKKIYFYVVKAVTEGGELSGPSIEIRAVVPAP
jgi:hypothetical protein